MIYETATDFEINQSVAWALGCHTLPVIDGDIDVFIVPLDEPQIFDPCNSWADAGPIIVENRISVLHSSEYRYKSAEWEAKTTRYIDDPNKDYVDEISEKLGHMSGTVKLYNASDINPLRAAMVVFLKMKEAE